MLFVNFSPETHSGQGKEGHADQGEGRCKKPSVPGYWIFITVANGRKSDLRDVDGNVGQF